MLTKGLATVYEAKRFAEFGGKENEERYRLAQERARRKKVGLWRLYGRNGWESPREYKERFR